MGKRSQPSYVSEEPNTYSENIHELEKTTVATQEMLTGHWFLPLQMRQLFNTEKEATKSSGRMMDNVDLKTHMSPRY